MRRAKRTPTPAAVGIRDFGAQVGEFNAASSWQIPADKFDAVRLAAAAPLLRPARVIDAPLTGNAAAARVGDCACTRVHYVRAGVLPLDRLRRDVLALLVARAAAVAPPGLGHAVVW